MRRGRPHTSQGRSPLVEGVEVGPVALRGHCGRQGRLGRVGSARRARRLKAREGREGGASELLVVANCLSRDVTSRHGGSILASPPLKRRIRGVG